MKKTLLLLAVPQFLFPFASFAQSMNLDQVYKRALQHVYEVKIQEEQKEQSAQQLKQAYGSVLPSIALRARHIRTDPITGIPGRDNKATTASLFFSQPLLQGLREYSALSIAKEQLNRQSFIQSVVQREVLFQVARVYYSYLIDQKDLENTKRLLDLTQQRVRDLEERVRIGRSRTSELLLAQSQQATVESRAKNLERELARWQTELERLTGMTPPYQFNTPSSDGIELKDLDFYLAQVSQLPELLSARSEVEVSEQQIKLQKRFHLPDLSVDGNYYLERTGAQADSEWDISVNFTLPLYEGNTVNSRVKEAAAQRNEATHRMMNLKRSLEAEIKELYSLIDLDKKRIEVTRRAVSLGQRNYREQQKEYNLGLVTNQEVLQALNSFIENQQVLDRLLLETAYNYTVLQAKVGELL